MSDQRMLALESESNLIKIREVLESIDTFLKASATHPQLHDDLALVLAEVLSNIARHGYGHDHGRIDLHLTFVGQCVYCVVRDSGVPFDPVSLDSSAPSPDSLSEGGYGWFLITALTRDLVYSREGTQNVLKFTVLGDPLQITDALNEAAENTVVPIS